MFVLILSVVLLTTNIVHSNEIECITNCTVDELKFGDKFSFPGAQCQQRSLESECTVRIDFNYHKQQYNVEFGKNRSSADFIYISALPDPYLSYTINHFCSDQTDCVFTDIQKKIDTMVGRSYNAKDIYGQLAPLIEGPSEGHTIRCYDIKNEIVTCAQNQVCGISYNQREKEIRARGCDSGDMARVYVYDSEYYSALHIDCTRSLCNDDSTLTRIKDILVQNGLTDSNGRRIVSAGTKEIISFSLLTFALISAISSYF